MNEQLDLFTPYRSYEKEIPHSVVVTFSPSERAAVSNICMAQSIREKERGSDDVWVRFWFNLSLKIWEGDPSC